MLIHGLKIVDSHGRIAPVHLAPESFSNPGRIASRVHDQRISHHGGIIGDALIERTVEDGARIFAKGTGLGISHNTNDLVRPTSPVNSLPNRVRPAKQLVGESLIDYGDARSLSGPSAEVAPF